MRPRMHEWMARIRLFVKNSWTVCFRQPMTEYRGAVLIIGSLWWDESPIRVTWRDTYLEIENKQDVNAPIRYGRLSESRNNTYTMVFSNLCYQEGMGTGLLVPFKNRIRKFDDLKLEAIKLWHSERPASNEETGEISCGWGTVGLIVNPNVEFSDEIIAAWKRYYQEQDEKPVIRYAPNETPIISKDGILNFEFPKRIDNNQLVDFDFVLATAIKPKPNRGVYPSSAQVAQACNENHYREYFDNNQEHGISTFQDEEILKLLHPKE